MKDDNPNGGCQRLLPPKSQIELSQDLLIDDPYPMRRNFSQTKPTGGVLLVVGLSLLNIAADSAAQANQAAAETAESGWGYSIVAGIAIAALGVAVYFWRVSRKNSVQPQFNYEARYRNNYNNHSYDMEGVDAEKELEWLRKAKKARAKPGKANHAPRTAGSGSPAATDKSKDINLDMKIFQEKMRKLQYAQLPINSFDSLSAAKLYEPLPLSNDPSLINAIEQANEEFEEDETVRDLAVRDSFQDAKLGRVFISDRALRPCIKFTLQGSLDADRFRSRISL